jgi:hypothetical protein
METVSAKEAEEIDNIVYQHFFKETGSDLETKKIMAGLLQMLQDPGVKLIHLGNTVFLMILVAPQTAEIHTMSADEDSVSLAKNFVNLAKFLKNVGVQRAYTYSNDPKFRLVARRTKLPIKIQEGLDSQQKPTIIYSMEFK